MSYHRDNIDRLEPYVPGEQPNDPQVVKLNTNENPYAPAQAVVESIRGLSGESLRRYPSPTAHEFRQLAADVHDLSPDMVIATNGGDELLRLAVTVFCEPRCGAEGGGGIGISQPTYSVYETLGQIHNTPIARVPLNEDWSLPTDFSERTLDARCRLVVVVNPHAPTGLLRPLSQLESIARRLRDKAVLLIDEAYVDFARHDALPLLRHPSGLDNVLIQRSLSKGYSLAGLRFGYGLAHPVLVAALDKARDSYNTDAVSQAAAVAALEHRHEAARTWQAVRDERNRLSRSLTDRQFRVLSSEANFVLAEPPVNGPDARAIYLSLKQKGILVRYFDKDRLRDKLRITVGSPQQNDALLVGLDELNPA